MTLFLPNSRTKDFIEWKSKRFGRMPLIDAPPINEIDSTSQLGQLIWLISMSRPLQLVPVRSVAG